MYDLLKEGFWPDDQRIPYKLIRWWLLDCYYSYDRHMIRDIKKWNKGWQPNEHEIGYAYEQCEPMFQLPIEQLMFEVLTLVLNAGRGPETVEPYHRAKIAAILAKHDLGEMLKEVRENRLQEDELQEFESDLKLLDLL